MNMEPISEFSRTVYAFIRSGMLVCRFECEHRLACRPEYPERVRDRGTAWMKSYVWPCEVGPRLCCSLLRFLPTHLSHFDTQLPCEALRVTARRTSVFARGMEGKIGEFSLPFPFLDLGCRVYIDVMLDIATIHSRSFLNPRRARSESYSPFVLQFLDLLAQ